MSVIILPWELVLKTTFNVNEYTEYPGNIDVIHEIPSNI